MIDTSITIIVVGYDFSRHLKKSMLTTHICQHMYVNNTRTPTHACQHMYVNTCMSTTRECQSMLANICISMLIGVAHGAFNGAVSSAIYFDDAISCVCAVTTHEISDILQHIHDI